MNDPRAGDCLFRAMTHDDLPAVAAIEEASQFTPWAARQFGECMASGYVCEVAEVNGKVVAFQVLSRVLDESHLLNLGVAPAFRRRGIAGWLLTTAMDRARRDGISELFLEVRRSNAPALGLYEKLGFVEVGFRRDYYRARRGREDAVVLRASLR